MANYEHDVPNTPSTVFRIASLTKQFTAAAILKLQENGLLSVDDCLKKYISDYPNSEKITLHHLLVNTSGIPDTVDIPGLMKSIRLNLPVEMLVDKLGRIPLKFEPGEQFYYSNSGYILLGYIIEKITGMSYENYLKENLFYKARMSNTGFDNAENILKHRASGYSLSENGPCNADFFDMSLFFACGCLYSTVEDLYKWHCALCEETLLNKKSVQAMLSPYINDNSRHYGYGWYLIDGCAYHNGITYGFKSKICRFNEERAVIIVLANNDFVSIDTLVNGLESILFEKEYESLIEPQIKNIDKKVYSIYTGTYKSEDLSREIFSIENENGRLFVKYYSYLKRMKIEIFPELILPDYDNYFAVDMDLKVSFKKQEDGSIKQAVMKLDNEEFYAWKI
ncbi:MAG TPA: serine hydrolase domain-containing protein, partial [Clostridia bacterium]